MPREPIDRSKPNEYFATFLTLDGEKTTSFYADNLDHAWDKAKDLKRLSERLRDVRTINFR